VLIRCNGNVLIPVSRIDKCEDKGDCIVVWVEDETHFARGEDAEVIRSLVAHKATQQPQAAKEKSHVRQEEGIARIPSFPGRKQGDRGDQAAR
jgi:hypothetical protein